MLQKNSMFLLGYILLLSLAKADASSNASLVSKNIHVALRDLTSESIDAKMNRSRGLDDTTAFDAIQSEVTYINSLLLNNYFLGSWSCQSDQMPADFTSSSGFAYVDYLSSFASQDDFSLSLYVYDGQYTDQNFFKITFWIPFSWLEDSSYTEYIPADKSILLRDAFAYISQGTDYQDEISSNRKSVNGTIRFINKNTNQPFIPTYNFEDDEKDIAIQFLIQNEEVKFDFLTSIMSERHKISPLQSIIFTVMMSGMALLQCITCHAVFKGLERGTVNPRKISIGTLRLFNAFNFYICLVTLEKYMDDFLIIGLAAIPYAILTIHFEFKLILEILTRQLHLPPEEQSKLSSLNCFWLLVSIFVVLMSSSGEPEWIYLSFAISQVPQIVQNFRLHQRYRWNYWILGPLSIPKFIYIYYSMVCEVNVFRTTPNSSLFYTIISIFAAQLLILFLQTRRPGLYQAENPFYKFSNVAEIQLIKQEICCICLEKMSNPHKEAKDPTSSDTTSTVEVTETPQESLKRVIVTTSCNHQFHESCLRGWLNFKYECPYCRSSLPMMSPDD